MNIIVAKHRGFCFGVKNAVEIAEKYARLYGTIYTIGPLIHNEVEVRRLKKLGVIPIKNVRNLKEKVLMTRTHGIEKNVLDELKKKGVKIIDATCPFVKKAQNLVKELAKNGYRVTIFGDKDHPEVKGLLSYSRNAIVISHPDEAKEMKITKKMALVSQTTQSHGEFIKVKNILMSRNKNVKFFDTTCRITNERQKEAKEIAEKSDVVIVVGGKNSANVNRILNICKQKADAHLIETKDEINKEWLKNKKNIGITGGTSTPNYLIDEVIEYVRKN